MHRVLPSAHSSAVVGGYPTNQLQAVLRGQGPGIGAVSGFVLEYVGGCKHLLAIRQGVQCRITRHRIRYCSKCLLLKSCTTWTHSECTYLFDSAAMARCECPILRLFLLVFIAVQQTQTGKERTNKSRPRHSYKKTLSLCTTKFVVHKQ